jgi:DNA-binding CsgD family transcriptional regulator
VHTRFAQAIEAEPGLVSRGRADVEKSHHWYSAHNTTGALASAWRSAVMTSNRVAHAERLMLLTRVLELWDQVPDAAKLIDADRVRVLQEAASAADDAGELQRGLAFTELALTLVDEATDPVRYALVLERRSTFRSNLGMGTRIADLRRALTLVPASLSKKARIQVLLSAAHCTNNDPEFRDWIVEGLEYAREDGDPDAEGHALASLAVMEAGASQMAGPGSKPLELLAEAAQVLERTDAYHRSIKLAILESHLLCGAGEFEQAARAAREGIADAERHGLARTGGAFLAINVAEPLFHLGRWDEAAEVAERALDLAPPPLTRAGLCLILGWLSAARGDLETALRRAASARAVLSGAVYEDQYHLPLATFDIAITLSTHGPVQATAIAAELIRRYDLPKSSPRWVWPLLTTAAFAAKRAPGADAASLLDELRIVAGKLEAFGPVQEAWRLSFTALAGAPASPTADCDDDAAPVDPLAAADAAAEAWEAVGQPFPAVLALMHAARTALAARATREATARLRRAAPLAERLGVSPLGLEISELTRRSGADSDAGDPVLTGRELEVLRLVAAGRSNREIATALVISPKTASVHVSNILAKLGAATRTEAAVKAHQLLLL